MAYTQTKMKAVLS